MRLMEQHADRIQDSAQSAALSRPGGQFELRACTFGGDTVALGAAIMPLESLVSSPLAEMQSRARRAPGR